MSETKSMYKEGDNNNHLTNQQIELVANLFSERETIIIGDENFSIEWYLSHAFQLGAKWYREYSKTIK